jgi:hypothetical protein
MRGAGQLPAARRHFGSERGALPGRVQGAGVLAEIGDQLPGGADITPVERGIRRYLRGLITR